jgi:hypothetical protein
MSSNDELLRYPIGKFMPKDSYTSQEMQEGIKRIEILPGKIEDLVRNFSAGQYDTRYREGGWTARQVLHHLPDSHMNAYIRFKWTLTEETPMIKAYDEKLWAETPEVKLDPQVSVNFLKALHAKWVALLKLIKPEDLKREFIHPETKKNIRLERLVAMYAWHGEHHLGHLEIVLVLG